MAHCKQCGRPITFGCNNSRCTEAFARGFCTYGCMYFYQQEKTLTIEIEERKIANGK